MIPYQTKSNRLIGTNYKEVYKNAMSVFRKIESATKRKPYIRSAYFRSNTKKQKIFFDYFWVHLSQKGPKERVKRLQYFATAIELLQKSRNKPIVQENPHKRGEILYRFTGLTKNKELFCVQVKEDKKTKQKYFMSCFPL